MSKVDLTRKGLNNLREEMQWVIDNLIKDEMTLNRLHWCLEVINAMQKDREKMFEYYARVEIDASRYRELLRFIDCRKV